MNKIFVFLYLLLSFLINESPAQSPQIHTDSAIAQVFNVLTGKETAIPDSIPKYLERGAWEALAYLEKENATQQDLQQAVPDYYSFKNGKLLLKLINPENLNEYGTEVNVPYLIDNQDNVVLKDPKTDAEKARWQVMYLDANYLAMEVAGLRIFFTQTALQE